MDNNLETKNEYFLRKQEKNEIANAEKKKKTVKKLLRWLVVIVGLGLLAWPIYSYFKKTSVVSVKPGQKVVAQSRDHIDPGKSHPEYNSNPPTGGWHYAQPAQSGIYDKELPDEQLVHNLEHSHVWIAYRPDLPSDQVEMLADIAKDYGSKIIMTKRAANDSRIALVAWEYILKMEDVNEEQVRQFIDAYRGVAGPEKLADYGFKDFRTGK